MSDEMKKYLRDLIGFTFDSDDIKYIENHVTNLHQENEDYKSRINALNHIVNHLQKENEQLRTVLNGTTHCYDETELRAFKKKINDILEYCRTTQMTFEEFIELNKLAEE